VNKENSEDNEKNSQLLEHGPTQHVKGPRSSEEEERWFEQQDLDAVGYCGRIDDLGIVVVDS
jgi:hypothetical protein